MSDNSCKIYRYDFFSGFVAVINEIFHLREPNFYLSPCGISTSQFESICESDDRP